MPKKPPTAKVKKGNHNARKHGAYSARLLPEEQEVYERIRQQFEKELGADNLTASDQRLIHQLAVIAAKFDSAVEKGAPPDALHILNRMVLDLLRELKATRASKNDSGLTGNSPAEVVAMMLARVRLVEGPKSVNALPRPAQTIDAEVSEVEPDDDGSGE